MITPTTPEALADVLRDAAQNHRSVRLGGAFTKERIAGEPYAADVTISSRCLNRVIEYDPRDLTISVEAGLPWSELCRVTAEHRQMVPLDPPWFDQATVGGVIAGNQSGPRRRLYGSARDLVIGMTFATLEGKLVQTGGKVVKNVAGLDMAKLMIGSWGTLAAITVVNFKLAPMPALTRTFLRRFPSASAALVERDRVLKSYLQPAAIDLLNEKASVRVGEDGVLLALQAGGNEAVLDRYSRELPGWETRDGSAEEKFWMAIREFTPSFLAEHDDGGVRRVSVPLTEVGRVLAANESSPVVVRAGSGVCYVHDHKRVSQGPPPAGIDVMRKIKGLFDPNSLLNKGRLYGYL